MNFEDCANMINEEKRLLCEYVDLEHDMYCYTLCANLSCN